MQTPPVTSTGEPFPHRSPSPLTLPPSAASLHTPLPSQYPNDPSTVPAIGSAGDGPPLDAVPEITEPEIDPREVRQRVDEITSRVDELENQVNVVTMFYSSKNRERQNPKGAGFILKEKAVSHRRHAENVRRDGTHSKRMIELMRQFGTILRNISQHKYAWPFMDPVDVEGLNLHDYYEIIKKPMDLGTIRKRMEAKDGSGYKNLREIYADVRLVFTNAMTYNSETHDVHKMAKAMLDKFEEKWQLLLPKVIEEETRHKEEESQTQVDLQISQETAYAKLARDTNEELNELSSWLDELKQMVLMKCRKISTEEKRKMAASFGILPADEICKAIDLIIQLNPIIAANEQNLDLNIDKLDEGTLWSMKFQLDTRLDEWAKTLEARSRVDNSKRRREICQALARTAKKRIKKAESS